MARRPAYNTKAERARRAEIRESLIAELREAGEALDQIVPFMSAWIQLQRRLAEYRLLQQRDYSAYNIPSEREGELAEARWHNELAFAYSYAAAQAAESGSLLFDRARTANLSALAILSRAVPFSDAELNVLKSLYSDDPGSSPDDLGTRPSDQQN